MGSEDINTLDGGPCQRIQSNFNSHPGRLMQTGHFSQVYHSPPAGKYRPPGFNDNKGEQHFAQKPEKDFHKGSPNMFSSMKRDMGTVEGEGQKIVNENPHVGGAVNTALRVQSWAEIDRRDRIIGEVDYRNVEERGEASTGSQSDGSDEDDEGDGNIDAEGKSDFEERGRVGSVVELGQDGQKSYQVLPHVQIGSLEGRQDPASGLQSTEVFQKANYDRERGSQVSTSATPSLGIFLSPSSYIPFLNSYSSQSTQPTVVHAEANAIRNGLALVQSGLGTSLYYRDGNMKESDISRDSYATEASNSIHGSSRISHVVPVHDAIPLSVVPDSDHYYGALLQSPGKNSQKDSANDVGAFGNKKSDETVALQLRAILSDPVTGLLMDDANILPCGHSFGSDSLQRVIETSACISCGATIKREDVTPNHGLRLVVQAFRREDEFWRINSSRSMKRKRDQDGVASVEQISFESSRGRGVQFPYVVNDKVLIKGNKRTPERFVGREAVITTQCLNGWYVVRTLDNGESVKLQYRSLKKLGEHTAHHEIQPKPGPNWL